MSLGWSGWTRGREISSDSGESCYRSETRDTLLRVAGGSVGRALAKLCAKAGHRGTSLARKRTLLGPFCRPMYRVTGGS